MSHTFKEGVDILTPEEQEFERFKNKFMYDWSTASIKLPMGAKDYALRMEMKYINSKNDISDPLKRWIRISKSVSELNKFIGNTATYIPQLISDRIREFRNKRKFPEVFVKSVKKDDSSIDPTISTIVDNVKFENMVYKDNKKPTARKINIKLKEKDDKLDSHNLNPETIYGLVRNTILAIDTTKSPKTRGAVFLEFNAGGNVKKINLSHYFHTGATLRDTVRRRAGNEHLTIEQIKKIVDNDLKSGVLTNIYNIADLREGKNRDKWIEAIKQIIDTMNDSHTSAVNKGYDDDFGGDIFGEPDYVIVLGGVSATVTNAPSIGGGCSKTRSNKGQTMTLRTASNTMLKLHSPADRDKRSGGNNCAILAIKNYLWTNYGLTTHMTAEEIREYANLERGTLIHCSGDICDEFQQLVDAFAEIYGKNIVVTIEKVEGLASGNVKLMMPYKFANKIKFESEEFLVELAIMGITSDKGHYYSITERNDRHKCNDCGRAYYLKHKCSASMSTYYQAKVAKDGKNMISFSPKYIHNEPFDLRKAWVFDLETFFPNKAVNVAAEVYAVGLRQLGCDEQGNQFDNQYYYGETAIEQLCQIMINRINNKDAEQMYLIAHNGSRFDNMFVLRQMTKMGFPPDKDGYLKSDSSLLVCQWGKGKIRMWDTYRALPSSLASLARDFKLPVQKGDFDHEKIGSYEDAHTHREEVLKYLKGDIDVLAGVFEAHDKAVYERWGFHAVEHVTGPSMAFKLFAQSLIKQNIKIFAPIKEDKQAIRKSMYGGRVNPWRLSWESSVADNIRDAKDNKDVAKLVELYHEAKRQKSYVIPADITSLYPFAQSDIIVDGVADEKRAYPCGEAAHIDDAEIAEKAFKDGITGFYHVKFECPKSLNWPILPRKDKGKIQWSLADGEGTYTQVDLEIAVREGYKLTFIRNEADGYAAVVYPTKYIKDTDGKYYENEDEEGVFINPYHNVIMDLIELKRIASINGERAKRAIAKVLVNSIWGSCSYVAPNIKTTIIKHSSDFFEWNRKHELTDWSILNDGIYYVSGIEIDPETLEALDYAPEKRAPHLASYVLAHSRKVMTNAARIANGGTLHGNDWCILYTDTDSLYLTAKGYERLQKAGLVAKEELGHFDNDLKDYGKDPIIYEYYSRGPKSKQVAWLDANGNTGICTTLKGLPLDNAGRVKLQCVGGSDDNKNLINENYEVNIEQFKRECFVEGKQLVFSYSSMGKEFPKNTKLSGCEDQKVEAFTIRNNKNQRSTNITKWAGFDNYIVNTENVMRPFGWTVCA